MSRPRHLWSGDWEKDSAAVTEELGNRRQQLQAPDDPRPDEPRPETRQPRPPAGPSAAARAIAWLRRQWRRLRELLAAWQARRGRGRKRPRPQPARARRLRVALVAALVGLLSAAIAFGVVLLLVNSDNKTTASTIASSHPWLGVDLESIPLGSGVLIADVIPGSPAQAAGLEPGDMITALNGKPVSSVSDVSDTVNGLHVGSQLEIQYTLGLASPGSYTTRITLASRPSGYP